MIQNVPIVYADLATNTRNRQMWWANQHDLTSEGNSHMRKKLSPRNVIPAKKYISFGSGSLACLVRAKRICSPRDLMTLCVISLVRIWRPNPEFKPYMGHRWSRCVITFIFTMEFLTQENIFLTRNI